MYDCLVLRRAVPGKLLHKLACYFSCVTEFLSCVRHDLVVSQDQISNAEGQPSLNILNHCINQPLNQSINQSTNQVMLKGLWSQTVEV